MYSGHKFHELMNENSISKEMQRAFSKCVLYVIWIVKNQGYLYYYHVEAASNISTSEPILTIQFQNYSHIFSNQPLDIKNYKIWYICIVSIKLSIPKKNLFKSSFDLYLYIHCTIGQ